jgi:hypothetical protein
MAQKIATAHTLGIIGYQYELIEKTSPISTFRNTLQ